MIAGALSVGSFIMPEESIAGGAGAKPAGHDDPEPSDDNDGQPSTAAGHRNLLAAPDRWDWDKAVRTAEGAEVLQQFSTFFWTEAVTGEDGKRLRERVVTWTPRSPAEQEEAERFFAAATQINWNDPSIHKLTVSGPPRAKTPPQTLDRRIPVSKLVPLADVELSGVTPAVAAWACICGRADRRLPAGPSGAKITALVEFNLLIENRSRNAISLDAARCKLQLTRGQPVSAFPGHNNDPWLAPAFIEKNGEPLGSKPSSTLTLQPAASATCKVAFPMKIRLRESVAIKLCRSIELPLGGDGSIVLDKA